MQITTPNNANAPKILTNKMKIILTSLLSLICAVKILMSGLINEGEDIVGRVVVG